MKRMKLMLVLMCLACCTLVNASQQETIALASQGAPAHITANASFMEFDGKQFNLIREGSNQFTCMVIGDPLGRFEPSCFNSQAMQSVFPVYSLQMQLLYSGHSHEEANEMMAAAYTQGKFPAVESGALVYMMSPNNLIYNATQKKLVPTPVHQMYFFPKLDDQAFALEGKNPRLWQGFPHLSALIVTVD